MNPMLLCDFYKIDHRRQYPEGTTLVYSNFTPRKSRRNGVNEVVFFGLQSFIKDYFLGVFNRWFFDRPIEETLYEMQLIIGPTVGKDFSYAHITDLHALGYLPLEIKALPEGARVPVGVPMLTIKNTHPDFAWLTNYIETILSASLWGPCTAATIAAEYRKLLEYYAELTGGDKNFIDFQAHDFSFRGMYGLESGALSGAGHLLSFKGTDTIPAIQMLRNLYNADPDKELIGCSVSATEHSVMCAGGKENEFETYRRLLTEVYPSGVISIVSDTWDLWNVIANYLPLLKNIIMSRDGKLVIRPDSGDPADILCGDLLANPVDKILSYSLLRKHEAAHKGIIECLWDIFGGSINEKGYKVLDPHIGAIYGDSITLERAEEILKRLEDKGFASTNIIFGIGSYTYQYITRDTFSFAMKATYIEVNGEGREIFKDPITDFGEKKSAKGLLMVIDATPNKSSPSYELIDQVSWEHENIGYLDTVFKDGKIIKETSLSEIRSRLHD